VKVKVLYAGFITEITGKRQEEVEVPPNTTLRELLNRLAKKYGVKFESEVYSTKEEKLRPGIILLHNGINVKDDLSRSVDNNDFVTLMPPVSGGF